MFHERTGEEMRNSVCFKIKLYKNTTANLQGKRQANEVHHHLLVGQLHAEETQQSVEGFVVLLAAALLLTAQVDVSVQLLTVLRGSHTIFFICPVKL